MCLGRETLSHSLSGLGNTLHILAHCGCTHINTTVLTTPDPLSADEERWYVQSKFHVQCVVKFVMQYEKI